jgi:predicted ArsR family transcriptional regulator
MNQKLIQEIGDNQRLEILTLLKRVGGMSVKEMAAHFQTSYMGVKTRCLELERQGYLNTRRRAKSLGRPELIYRLTPRAHEFFPGASHQLTGEILEAVQQNYGPAAPTKLLFVVFGQRADAIRAQIGAAPAVSLAARAESLARLRDAEGYMAELLPSEDGASLRIVEHHSPIEDLLRRYPIIERLERELFERALGCRVRREERPGPEGYCCVFHLTA